MQIDELIDVYDENCHKTGITKSRYLDKLNDGEFLMGIQAVIINSEKKILISQRAKNKFPSPLMWECNGGALRSGEEPFDGVIREIYEELGIDLKGEKEILLKTVKSKNGFKKIFLFKKDVDVSDIVFKDNESCNAKWVTINEFEKMLSDGKIVNNVNFTKNDYNLCITSLNF